MTRFGEDSMDAMERALPLNLVTPLVDMRVGRDYHPLNQITFFYQRAFVHEMQWKGLEIDSLPDVPAVTGSEWQLGVVERNSGVYLEFLYDATLYSEATIRIVQRHFARLLREAVMAPDIPLSQLKLMTIEEMETIFDGRVCAACDWTAAAASTGNAHRRLRHKRSPQSRCPGVDGRISRRARAR